MSLKEIMLETKGSAIKKYLWILMLSIIFRCIAAIAQDVSFTRVETSEPFSPVYQTEEGQETLQVKGLAQSSAGNKKWFRISAEYVTNVDWLNRLTLEYYVLFPGETNAFKGTVNYVDIPRGREHLSEMYLHFNSYMRHYKRGIIQYAVVALINGRQVAIETNSRSPEGWWRNTPVYPCGLLDRSLTPFSVFNVEKFDAQCH